MVGFPGIDIHSPDSAALDLLDEACSDFGSRLFPLVPKVSAALWERWSWLRLRLPSAHDDLESCQPYSPACHRNGFLPPASVPKALR